MQRYLEMPTDRKKKNKDLLIKAGMGKADEEVLFNYVVLAYRVGFKSDEIKDLMQQSFDGKIARNALLMARKPDRYEYDKVLFQAYVARIVSLFTTAVFVFFGVSKPYSRI